MKREQYQLNNDTVEKFLQCENLQDLKNIVEENRKALVDIYGFSSIYPENLRDRVEVMNYVREGKLNLIKVKPVKRGMFLKVEVSI